MAFADRMVAVATRLIQKYGASATLTFKEALPKVDPARPWRGGTSTLDIEVMAVQHPYTEDEAPDIMFRRGNSRFIIAAPVGGANDYSLATHLTDHKATVWGIGSVDLIHPGATRILYLIEVAR